VLHSKGSFQDLAAYDIPILGSDYSRNWSVVASSRMPIIVIDHEVRLRAARLYCSLLPTSTGWHSPNRIASTVARRGRAGHDIDWSIADATKSITDVSSSSREGETLLRSEPDRGQSSVESNGDGLYICSEQQALEQLPRWPRVSIQRRSNMSILDQTCE
jgi:hypothetical protein